jgi:DNA repair protein RecN (Recombination protein N)
MLSRLSIRDVVLIDQLDLEFAPGLTILTGETGAGKSILLDALSLALGARGDGGLVRHGQSQGEVTATFELAAGGAAHALLEGQDIEIGDELILRRVQLADGRTRAYVNDRSVSAQALRGLASALVEIHGQHDERALTDPSTHRALVDAYGGLEPLAAATERAHGALRDAERTLEAERARVKAAEAEAEFAAHAHDELSKLDVQPNEEETLAARRQAMMQGEKVAADIRDARDHLTGDTAILPLLLSLSRRLQRRAPQAPALLEPSVKALDEAIDAVERATGEVEAALEASAFDPHELERCEERLFALRAMGRKHNVPIENLPALAQKFADDLAALAEGRSEVGRLEASVKSAAEAYHAAARALSARRETSARELATAVGAELAPLKLERAEFSVDLKRDDTIVSPSGYDRAEFFVRTNPGSRPGPLMKVASGGELARFLLAIKVRLAERGTAPTLVFDEIDTGVGGAVADAMGQRLARLSAGAQVLAVTHAPQVAARAHNHYRIAKSDIGAGERVATGVSRLGATERREEIARMLAGAEITHEARAAALSLIEKAERGQDNPDIDACFAVGLGPIKTRPKRRESRRQTTKDPA